MTTLENEAIARRLRVARENAGLSQGQVARLLDLHRPTISEIEAGRRRVTAEELPRFADIYEVSIDWLSRGGEPNEGDERIQLAARELLKLRPEDLDRVVELIQSLRAPPRHQRGK